MIELLQNMVKEIDVCARNEKFAIAFSGGLDSSLLAKISRERYKNVVLLTIGFPSSHDLIFSKSIAEKLNIDHIIYEIDQDKFNIDIKNIIMDIPCNNISHIENCLAFHYIAHACELNRIGLVLTANGFDELFCGYDGYRQIFSKGAIEINKFMEQKIRNELNLIEEIKNIIENKSNIKIKQPFLNQSFIDYAKKIPIERKIKGQNDILRKHILREIALSLQVPVEAALKPKKAIQYGSLIHKNFKKILKRDDDLKSLLMKKISH